MEIVLLFLPIYLSIGLVCGIANVLQNLARFHGGGFHWKRIAKYLLLFAFLWPLWVLG